MGNHHHPLSRLLTIPPKRDEDYELAFKVRVKACCAFPPHSFLIFKAATTRNQEECAA